ncbi:MAG: hypothetical protein SV377_01745 [Halobacteria archaeon]|nr:hypothetical protein [Halobacteria archaeon]
MVYRIGIVGVGHWSRRLKMGIEGGQPFEVHKTVDILPYEEKEDLLGSLGVDRERYYRISQGDPLPDGFFEELDVVQIASPVEFHKEQTLRSLSEGKMTITEKSYGANEGDFNEVVDFLDSEDLWHRSHLHLHYLRKLLTMEMPGILSEAIKEHGLIRDVQATFIEQESEEDMRRSWLFHPRNGGIFLDWIHPIEVVVWASSAEFTDLREAEGYVINADYTSEYPTAGYARYGVEGGLFSKGATATIRVGKGFEEGLTHKVLRFHFEDDAYIDFEYADSETEFNSDYRGEWVSKKRKDGRIEILDKGLPSGPIPYDFLLQDLLNALENHETVLEKNVMQKIFDPVWMFNREVMGGDLVRGRKEIQEFIDDALSRTSDKKMRAN